MRRNIAWFVAALVVLAATGAGIGAWWLARAHGSGLPQVSVYSRGSTVWVDPYLYCNVIDLNDCVEGGAQAELAVNHRYPVQLSVPSAISSAPWQLSRIYEDERTATTVYRPDTRLAVTIPTVDERHGRLVGLVVQLLTLVQDENGELRDLPHAEWSIRLVWSSSAREVA